MVVILYLLFPCVLFFCLGHFRCSEISLGFTSGLSAVGLAARVCSGQGGCRRRERGRVGGVVQTDGGREGKREGEREEDKEGKSGSE